MWAEASKRVVHYALCNDRRTLLWFANQRAIEYHPTLGLAPKLTTHPSRGRPRSARRLRVRRCGGRRAARPPGAGRRGLAGAVKTSGAKGVHVFVPVEEAARSRRWRPPPGQSPPAPSARPRARHHRVPPEDRDGKVFLDPTRAGGATVVAAYSPRLRPGTPVSFPVEWDDLTQSRRATSPCTRRPGTRRRGSVTEPMPGPQRLPEDLIEEGRAIPVARVAAMHEGIRQQRYSAIWSAANSPGNSSR